MAKNLRTKIPKTDTMVVQDVNPTVTQQFAEEMGNVEVVQTVREVAEKSVRSALHSPTRPMMNTQIVLSMI